MIKYAANAETLQVLHTITDRLVTKINPNNPISI